MLIPISPPRHRVVQDQRPDMGREPNLENVNEADLMNLFKAVSLCNLNVSTIPIPSPVAGNNRVRDRVAQLVIYAIPSPVACSSRLSPLFEPAGKSARGAAHRGRRPPGHVSGGPACDPGGPVDVRQEPAARSRQEHRECGLSLGLFSHGPPLRAGANRPVPPQDHFSYADLVEIYSLRLANRRGADMILKQAFTFFDEVRLSNPSSAWPSPPWQSCCCCCRRHLLLLLLLPTHADSHEQDGSGTVSIGEVLSSLNSLGALLSEEEVKTFTDLAKTDDDGYIHYDVSARGPRG